MISLIIIGAIVAWFSIGVLCLWLMAYVGRDTLTLKDLMSYSWIGVFNLILVFTILFYNNGDRIIFDYREKEDK